VRIPAARLTLTARIRQRHEAFLTVVGDQASSRVSDVSFNPASTSQGNVTECRVTMGAHADVVVATTGAPSVGAFETDASLAVWRFADARVVEAVRIGGSYMRLRGSADQAPARIGVAV
jgi:hypothetical protein